MIRVAARYRLGLRTCEPHICPYGKHVDARGLDGLSCRRSSARRLNDVIWRGRDGLSCRRSSARRLNDVIWRAIKRAHIPVAKELVGLSRTDGKRPDGATLLSWSREKPLALGVTVLDTVESHLKDTVALAGAAANQAATFKTTKCMPITTTHIYVPIVIETSGAWNNEAIEIMQEIGKRITSISSDVNETNYMFQRISITIQ